MWDKLEQVERHFEELSMKLSTPEVIKNSGLFQKYSREHKELTELVATFRAYRKAKEELQGSKEIMQSSRDAEMVELASEEARLLAAELDGLEQRLKLLLVPKDPNDDKNII